MTNEILNPNHQMIVALDIGDWVLDILWTLVFGNWSLFL